MCDNRRYFKSSIPPKLQGDQIGSLVFKFLKFYIHDEITRTTATRFRLLLWGQDDGIDIYHSQLQKHGEVTVEYPLVGSTEIVRRYFYDLGVLVLPIMNGKEHLLGLGNIHLSEAFGELIRNAEKGKRDATWTSFVPISVPLIPLTMTKATEEKPLSFQSVRFGEIVLTLELTMTSSQNSSIKTCKTARKREDVEESHTNGCGDTESTLDNPGKLPSLASITDRCNGHTNDLREKFTDVDDNGFSLATENDSILLAAILEEESDVKENLVSGETGLIPLNTMLDTKIIPVDKQCEHKIAQSTNLSKQSIQKMNSGKQQSANRVVSLCVRSVKLTKPCLSPLLQNFKGQHATVKGWIEIEIPPFDGHQFNSPQIFSVPFVCKTLGRKKDGRSMNARGTNKLMKPLEKQLLAHFESRHELSSPPKWNVKIRNDNSENELQALLVQMSVFIKIEAMEKCTTQVPSNERNCLKKDCTFSKGSETQSHILKLGVAQLNIGAMLRDKESYTDFSLPFGPISTNMSFINLDVYLTRTTEDMGNKGFHSAGSNTLKLDEKWSLQGNYVCEDSKFSQPANPTSALKVEAGMENEPGKESKSQSQCPKLPPYWIYIRLSNLRDLIKITRKSVIIKVHQFASCKTNCETRLENTIFGETVTIKNCPALYFVRSLMLKPCRMVSNRISDFVKIDIRQHINAEPSSSVLLSEISIPLNLNVGLTTPGDIIFFFSDKVRCKSQIKSKVGIHMDVTVAIGSLAQIDNFEIKIESCIKLQRWWKRRKYGDGIFVRGSTTTEKEIIIDQLQYIKCANVIKQSWRRQRQRKTSNDEAHCHLMGQGNNKRLNLTMKVNIREEKCLQDREIITSDRSDYNESPRHVGPEYKAHGVIKYPTYDVEIELGTCIGIREMLALWDEGCNVNTNSGFFVTFSILARSKTNLRAQPEVMYFSTAIKMIKTVKRHQIMLKESYIVLLDNSEVIRKYIQSEMMEVKLWFVPAVTELMNKYYPPWGSCSAEVPQMARLVGTTKCPLYMLTGSTAVSYFCPWRLEKGSEIDTVGKIQITFRLNGSTTDDISIINLESSHPTSFPTIFDLDLPDQIQCILPKQRPNRGRNLIKDSSMQYEDTGGTKSLCKKTDLLYHGKENHSDIAPSQIDSQKTVMERNRKSGIPNVYKANRRLQKCHHNTSNAKICRDNDSFFSCERIETKSTYNSQHHEFVKSADVMDHKVGLKAEDILPIPEEKGSLFQSTVDHLTAPSKVNEENEDHAAYKSNRRLGKRHHNTSNAKICMDNDSFFYRGRIETKSTSNSQHQEVCSDVIDHNVALKAEDILPIPEEKGSLFQSTGDHLLAPSKVNEEHATKKCPDKLMYEYNHPKEYQCLEVPQSNIQSPIGGMISRENNRDYHDMNSKTFSVSSDDASIYTQKLTIELKKDKLSRCSSDESSTDMNDPQQHTGQVIHFYKSPSSSSSSSRASEMQRGYFMTSKGENGKKIIQSRKDHDKYSDNDSSSTGSLPMAQPTYHTSREEVRGLSHEDDVSTSEIESIDWSSETSSWD